MKLLSVVNILVACASAVHAFEDTSPFIVLSSNQELDLTPTDDSTLTTETAISSTINALNKCPADAYILVNQPGLHSSDFDKHSETSSAAPFLFKLLGEAASSYEVANLFYSGQSNDLNTGIASQCDAEVINVDAESGGFTKYIDTKPRVLQLEFEPLPTDLDTRLKQIRKNDDILKSVVQFLPSANYVLVYTSSPGTADLNTVADAEVESTSTDFSTQDQTLPGDSLFENYAFFSPGIFMGIIVSLLLLAVGYEGLNWIASLQVTYRTVEPLTK